MKKSFVARYRAITALVLAAFLLVGPNFAQDGNPALGFNVLSPEKEAQMGAREFSKYKKSKRSITRGRQHEMTQRVAARLTRVVNVKNADWEFVLFDDPTPNAFALPGGKVGVHTGLFKVVQNEPQLAAVLGHELAHVTARHSGKRISNAAAGSAIGAIAGAILKRKTGMDRAPVIAQGAATLRLLQFSRKQELEADRLGAIYMAKAGYDPRQSVELWKRFAAYKAQKAGPNVPGFLSTHPVDSRRIEELNEMMPEALKHYGSGSGSASKKDSAPSAVRALRFNRR